MKTFNKIKAFKYFLFAFLLFATGATKAQIGIGIANPSTSAQLDVSSTNKGFLPPRMTQAERNAILSPVPGLMIWCSDCGVLGEIQVYNGATWMNMTGGYAATPAPANFTTGNLEWMTKNLDVAIYRNGDSIPQVTDATKWANLTTGAWCYYDNDPAKGAVYGKLYNRAAIIDPRGLAPEGWHIPDKSEWLALSNMLGGDLPLAYPNPVAGDKMRASVLWNNSTITPNITSGFIALPGGKRDKDGSFSSIGNMGKWWSTSEYNNGMGWQIWNYYLAPEVNIENFSILSGLITYSIYKRGYGTTLYPTPEGVSVRCVRDVAPTGVKIDGVEWMQNNLNVTNYRNGDPIKEVYPLEHWERWDTLTTGAWCYSNDLAENGYSYGKLYNWYAVNDPRGLAPEGWHVASDSEWNNLTTYLGGDAVAGNKIKETGNLHWDLPNSGATNETKFMALPAGKIEDNLFKQFGNVGAWWTSTVQNSLNAWFREVNASDAMIFRGNIKKQSGFSVRCIKD